MLNRLLYPNLLSIVFIVAAMTACAPSERIIQGPTGSLSESGLSAEALLHRAGQAETERDYATARAYYNRYLQQYPDDLYEAEVLTKLGKVHGFLGNRKAARSFFRKVESKHPQSVWATEAMLHAGRSYLQSNDIVAALAQADKVIARKNVSDEQRRQGYLLRGNSYAQQQDPQSALANFLRVYELTDPQLLPDLKQKVQSYLANIDNETLIAVQRETPKGSGRNWLTYLIGVRLMEQEKNQAAVAYLSNVVSEDPDSLHANDARSRIARLHQLATPGGKTAIGCLLPLSGPYQAIGESALAGIELALYTLGRQYPNHRFSITVADTAGDDIKAVAALERLRQKKVVAIIGPIVTAKAVGLRANGMALPLLALNQSADIPQIGPFIFRNFITPEMQVQALADYAVIHQGIDRLAVLYPNEKYGRYHTDLFRAEVQVLGGQIVTEVFYAPGSTDFKEPVRELLRAEPGFDALFIPDEDETVGLILPQLRFYDIKNKTLLGTNLWYTDKLIKMAASYAREAICPADFYKESSTPQVAQFVTAIKRTYHQKPSYINAIAYDTTAILFKVLTTAVSDDPVAIRETLIHMAPHDGLTGKSWFEQNGEVSKEITLVRIHNNRFESISEN